jgi:hypothetical protein
MINRIHSDVKTQGWSDTSLPAGIYAPLIALHFAKKEMGLSVTTACKSLESAGQDTWEQLPGGSRVQSRTYGVREGSFKVEDSKITMAAGDLLVTFERNPDANTDTDRTVEDTNSMTPYELYTSGKVILTSICGKRLS